LIEFVRADKNKFAVFHTLYTDTNIFARFDWNERIESAKNCVSDSGYFIYNDSAILGGFSLKGNNVNYPFLVPPFCNKVMFWDYVYFNKNIWCRNTMVKENYAKTNGIMYI
jgi:hypothetical protein